MGKQDCLIIEKQIAAMNIHYYYYSFEYFLDVQRKLGCSSIELWGGSPHIWVDHLSYNDCKIIKKQFEQRNLDIVAFTPECTSYRYMLCATDPDRHRKSIEYFKKCIKVTAELGVSMMTINTMGKYQDEGYDTAWARCVESVSILCEEAKQNNVTLAMETLCPDQLGVITNLNELTKLFAEVNNDNLKALLDLVSVESAGESIDQWFATLGEKIVHTHFVDGRNTSDHLVWGDGCYPLGRFITKLNDHGYKGYLGQEITSRSYYNDPASADMKNMKALRKYLKC